MPRSNENVARGGDFRSTFTTYDSGSDPLTPVAAPTISSIHVNGVAATIAGSTITQLSDLVPATITGYYQIRVPTSTLAIHDQVDIRITCTILGKVRFETFSFTVVDATTSMPYIA